MMILTTVDVSPSNNATAPTKVKHMLQGPNLHPHALPGKSLLLSNLCLFVHYLIIADWGGQVIGYTVFGKEGIH